MKQLLLTIKRKFSGFFNSTAQEPELSVVSHFYQGHTIHVLLQDRTGNKITLDVQKIARQKTLITQLSASDAFLLGYLLAESNSHQELLSEDSLAKH